MSNDPKTVECPECGQLAHLDKITEPVDLERGFGPYSVDCIDCGAVWRKVYRDTNGFGDVQWQADDGTPFAPA